MAFRALAHSNRLACAFACALLALFSSPAHADDAPLLNVGGHLIMLSEGQTNVRMTSERVVIRLKKKGYETHATFYLHNDGEACHLTVGFPIASMGYVGYLPFPNRLAHARARVNSKSVAPKQKPGWWYVRSDTDRVGKNHPGSLPVGELKAVPDQSTFVEEMHWLTKEVDFPAHGDVTTEITYSSEYSMWQLGTGGVNYYFGSGSGWKGPIGEMTFEIIPAKDRWIAGPPKAGIANTTMCRKADGRIRVTYRDVEPSEVGIFSVQVGGLVEPDGTKRSLEEWLDMTDYGTATDWWTLCTPERIMAAIRDHDKAKNKPIEFWESAIAERQAARQNGTDICRGISSLESPFSLMK